MYVYLYSYVLTPDQIQRNIDSYLIVNTLYFNITIMMNTIYDCKQLHNIIFGSLPVAVVSCPANMNVSTSALISSSLNPLPSSSYVITAALITEIIPPDILMYMH